MRRLVTGWLFLLVFVTVVVGNKLSAGKLNELVRGNGGEPETLDPQKMSAVAEGWIGYDLFEGLVANDANGGLIPAQAESWAFLNNGKTVRFTLRRNLKWSDGRPLTANDFEYSIKRLADPETAAPLAWFLEALNIENAFEVIRGGLSPDSLGVKAVQSYVLEFYLLEPVCYFPQLLVNYVFLPAPRHVIEKYGRRWTQPNNFVSNGAFRLAEWQVNEKVRAVRNGYYRENGKNKIDSVSYITTGDELNRFRSGGLHITNTVVAEHQEWARSKKLAYLKEEPWISTSYLVFNLNKKNCSDPQLRRALATVIDRDMIAKSRVGGAADAAWQFTAPLFKHFNPTQPEIKNKSQKERIDEGLSIFNQLKENVTTISLAYNSQFVNHKKLAVVIARQWEQALGIKVRLEGVERQILWNELIPKGLFDVVLTQWGGPYNDPASMLSLHHSTVDQNIGKYNSEEYDQLLDRARRIIGKDKDRMRLYELAEKVLMTDIPVIPLTHNKCVRLVSDKVQGYTGKNMMGRVYSRHLSLQ